MNRGHLLHWSVNCIVILDIYFHRNHSTLGTGPLVYQYLEVDYINWHINTGSTSAVLLGSHTLEKTQKK